MEEGTGFGELYRAGRLPLPEDESLIDMYLLAGHILQRAGYRRYEISNFSKPGFECRHNLIYWRSGNYIGFGAGAHSHMSSGGEVPWGMRWANIKEPNTYMKRVSQGKLPLDFQEVLDRERALEDRLLMELRLLDGVELYELERRFGVKLDLEQVKSLLDNGLIELSSGVLKLSEKGLLVSNEVILRIAGSFTFEVSSA